MAMTTQQYNKYYDINKDRDNYPKYIHIGIEHHTKYTVKTSAVCIYNGIYIRQYDNNRDKYYYYNKTYSVYLFIANDGMWTVSDALNYEGTPYLFFCPSTYKNILESNNWLWSNGEKKLKLSVYIYYPKNNKITKDTHETYTQTSIDFSKFNKKERKHIKRCGINNKPNRVIKVSNKDKCSICWDELMFLDKKAELVCGHVFHTECIFKWIFSKKTCPNCRKNHTLYM